MRGELENVSLAILWAALVRVAKTIELSPVVDSLPDFSFLGADEGRFFGAFISTFEVLMEVHPSPPPPAIPSSSDDSITLLISNLSEVFLNIKVDLGLNTENVLLQLVREYKDFFPFVYTFNRRVSRSPKSSFDAIERYFRSRHNFPTITTPSIAPLKPYSFSDGSTGSVHSNSPGSGDYSSQAAIVQAYYANTSHPADTSSFTQYLSNGGGEDEDSDHSGAALYQRQVQQRNKSNRGKRQTRMQRRKRRVTTTNDLELNNVTNSTILSNNESTLSSALSLSAKSFDNGVGSQSVNMSGTGGENAKGKSVTFAPEIEFLAKEKSLMTVITPDNDEDMVQEIENIDLLDDDDHSPEKPNWASGGRLRNINLASNQANMPNNRAFGQPRMRDPNYVHSRLSDSESEEEKPPPEIRNASMESKDRRLSESNRDKAVERVNSDTSDNRIKHRSDSESSLDLSDGEASQSLSPNGRPNVSKSSSVPSIAPRATRLSDSTPESFYSLSETTLSQISDQKNATENSITRDKSAYLIVPIPVLDGIEAPAIKRNEAPKEDRTVAIERLKRNIAQRKNQQSTAQVAPPPPLVNSPSPLTLPPAALPSYEEVEHASLADSPALMPGPKKAHTPRRIPTLNSALLDSLYPLGQSVQSSTSSVSPTRHLLGANTMEEDDPIVVMRSLSQPAPFNGVSVSSSFNEAPLTSLHRTHLPPISELGMEIGTIMEGQLNKQSYLLRMWQPRYMVLRESATNFAELCIYKHSVASAWGIIPLRQKACLPILDIAAVEAVDSRSAQGKEFIVKLRAKGPPPQTSSLTSSLAFWRRSNSSSSLNANNLQSLPTTSSGRGATPPRERDVDERSDRSMDSMGSDAYYGTKVMSIVLQAEDAERRLLWVTFLNKTLRMALELSGEQ
eukprot:gene4196-4609_t